MFWKFECLGTSIVTQTDRDVPYKARPCFHSRPTDRITDSCPSFGRERTQWESRCKQRFLAPISRIHQTRLLKWQSLCYYRRCYIWSTERIITILRKTPVFTPGLVLNAPENQQTSFALNIIIAAPPPPHVFYVFTALWMLAVVGRRAIINQSDCLSCLRFVENALCFFFCNFYHNFLTTIDVNDFKIKYRREIKSVC